MRKLVFLLGVLALAAGVSADCSCYEAGNYTGKSAPISNSYDPDNFSSCYKECTYVAYSGDDTYGWTGLTINWGTTTGSGGSILIYDGTVATGTPIIQVAEGENVLSGSTKSLIKSSSPRITIEYTQTGTGANVYYGVIKATPGLQPSAAPVTTTAIPTTRTYSNPLFKNDPYLITHDLLVVVNQRTSGGISTLQNLNALVYNFVTLLSTTTDYNSAQGTRLSLATLTPYDPYYSVQGGIWELDANSLNAALPKSGISIEGDIDKALMGLADLVFTVNTNSSTDSRPNVQRSILLLTGEWPTTVTMNDDVKNKFDGLGANLLVVGYNLNSSEANQLQNPERWYNAINVLTSKNSDVATFVNAFYFNDKSQQNFWCPPLSIQPSIDKTFHYFQEPNNYQGPIGSGSKLNWNNMPPYYGQSNRYCNFANNQYVYQNPTNAILTVQVFFELEAGKDFLSFYDASNNLIATFTGYDISGSSFITTTSQLTAQFISDNKSVYRGFYVQITP